MLSPHPAKILVPAVALMALAMASPAFASAPAADELEQKAAARALFNEGLAFADAQRWEDAADRFERARSLRPTPEIAYNLSTSLVRLNRLVRATELLRQIMEDPQAASAVKTAARARLAEVVPRLAYLTIKLSQPNRPGPNGSSADTLVVLLDGHPFDEAGLGVSLPVDPVSHTVYLRLGTSVLERREILLDEGERRTVSFESGPAVPLSRGWDADRVLVPVPNGLAGRVEPRRGNAWVWVLVGAAVAVGLTATTVVVAMQDSPPPPRGNVDTWTLGN